MTNQDPNPATWSAPAGFEPVSSALEGITVYAPRKQDEQITAPATYQCPNCGATTRYDVSTEGVACEFCGYRVQTRANQVGLQAKEHEFDLDTLSQAKKTWGEDARETHCDSCGAELILRAGSLTTTCPFCGSNRVNVREIPADVLRPECLIPFKVQADAIGAKASEWLGKGWFHPGELKKTAGISRFNGVYLPHWTFDATIHSHWKAEVGYERQERYYDAGSKSWKSRTVIDWRWEDGDVTIQVDDLQVPGTARLSRVILERIYPFTLTELVEFHPDFLAGWQAQMVDVPLEDAWEDGKEQMREQAKEACHKDIPTSHVRNFSMSADFADEVWRYILLPVYIANYRFENKTYQVMVNGQNGVIAGQKPVAWWKIWAAIAAMLAPGVILGLVGLVFLAAGGIGLVPLIIGAVLMLIGGVFAVMVYRQALASEAE